MIESADKVLSTATIIDDIINILIILVTLL